MEGRIAQRQGEAILRQQHSLEDVLRRRLLSQLDGLGEAIGRDDGACRGQSGGVDIAPGEVPAVLPMADQRVDAVGPGADVQCADRGRSEEHTSELQSLMRISYAVFCLKKKKNKRYTRTE